MKKGIVALVIIIAIVAVILYFVLKPPAVKEVVIYTSLENEEIVEYLALAKK